MTTPIRIGLFAKMNRVTVKTLRYYDRAGLLKPAYTDTWTGYRSYTLEQMDALQTILNLKGAGFTIREIQDIVGQNIGRAEMIRILETRVSAEQERIGHIISYIAYLRKEPTMDTVTIKSLPNVTVASLRTTVPNYDAFFSVVPKMGDTMRKQGAVCAEPEYCFTMYHDGEYKESDIDVEICEAVVEARPETDGVTYKRLDAVPEAACVYHRGPYRTIGGSYKAVMGWIAQNGYEVADSPRESYIDGIWNKDSEDDWLTEIQVPVKKR